MKVFHQLHESLRNYIVIVSISLIVLAILVLYWQDLSILANEALQSEAVSHILLVPLLATFLIYQKRELAKASLALERLRTETQTLASSEIIGISVFLSALLIYWYGSYTFYPLEYHLASLVVFLIGTILMLFNIRMLKALIFPILFLLFLIPPPSFAIFTTGGELGNFSAQASYTIVKILGIPITLSSEYGPPTLIVGNTLEGPLKFAVDLSCSGIYSLMQFITFATFLVYVVRGSITRRIALFPIGFTMLTILNIIRISTIAMIAYQFGEAIAMTIFHTFSGLLQISIGILLLLLIAEKLLHLRIFPDIKTITSCNKCNDPSKNNGIFCISCGKLLKGVQIKLPKKFWIKITTLLLFCYLATLTIQAPVFAFTQKLMVVTPNLGASTETFPQIPSYKLIFLYRYLDFEKISRQDATLLYAYLSLNASSPDVYVLIGVAGSISNLHSWEVCLYTWQTARGYPPLLDVLEDRDTEIMQNPSIAAKYFVFQHPDNYTQVTLYWYQKALFKTGLTNEAKFTRISLIIFTKNQTDYPQYEQQLLSIGRYIVEYWEPIKTQSLLSLGIPTMQVLLGSMVLFAAIIQTTQFAKEWKRKTTNLKIFEMLASPEEKLLYHTIKQVNQKTKPSTQDVASAYEKASGKAPDLNELADRLNTLEENGMIKADIINILDHPKLVWKP